MCLSIGDSTVEGPEEEEDAIVVGQYYVTLFVEGSVDTLGTFHLVKVTMGMVLTKCISSPDVEAAAESG